MNRLDRFADTALGLVSTESFPAIVGIADMMLKSSDVTLVGYEKTGGGYCTAVVRGGISDVRLAVQEGIDLAAQFGQKVSTLVVPRPLANLEAVLPIGTKLAELAKGQRGNPFRNQAVGLLETRGFPAMVGAADAMLKSADVTLTAYETIGSGLCTAIVRGTIANKCLMAIDVGMQEAERIGELHSVMVIPRALEDLDQTLPLASCWVEEVQPLRLPINIKEVEKERVALPELQTEQQQLAESFTPLQLPESRQMQVEALLEFTTPEPIAEIIQPPTPEQKSEQKPEPVDDRPPEP
ncbi:MAG: carbon dioxide-concentrating mechanism protein [Leptolyngbyaceae cyanobacterium SU_3_3]|nr:carbon dioxide-concentrating mechanism protein [Leptolyngbyaceae cyanobacterium SU_3_3]